MEMPVDQARRQVRALEVDDLLRLVVAQTDDPPVIHRYVRAINLAAQDVDEVGVLKEPLRGRSPRAMLSFCWRFRIN